MEVLERELVLLILNDDGPGILQEEGGFLPWSVFSTSGAEIKNDPKGSPLARDGVVLHFNYVGRRHYWRLTDDCGGGG